MKRDLRRLVEEARRRGWRVDRTGGDHLRLRHPTGAMIFAASTPSCPRALRNLQADLRRVERREVGE